MTQTQRIDRSKLWLLAILGAAFSVFVGGNVCVVLLAPHWMAGPSFRELHPSFRELDAASVTPAGRNNGVRIVTLKGPEVFETAGDTIRANPVNAGDVQAFLPIFAEELGLYPRELLQGARLHCVVLCTGLSLNGQPVGGLPDLERGDLYVDVGCCTVRGTIHHEFFHLLDYRDDGELYTDPAWAAPNPPGFCYGRGGRLAEADGAMSRYPSDRVPGFLNDYSTTAVEEDKAEVYAFLLVRPGHLAGRAKVDPVVRAKVARMKALLRDFCPAIDDGFWERVKQVREQNNLHQ